jgi:hypothetical protein
VGTQADLMLSIIWLKMGNASIFDSSLLPSGVNSISKGQESLCYIILELKEIMVFKFGSVYNGIIVDNHPVSLNG